MACGSQPEPETAPIGSTLSPTKPRSSAAQDNATDPTEGEPSSHPQKDANQQATKRSTAKNGQKTESPALDPKGRATKGPFRAANKPKKIEEGALDATSATAVPTDPSLSASEDGAGPSEDGSRSDADTEEEAPPEDDDGLISLDQLARAERLARQTERARQALASIESPNNDLGLVTSVSQRAADVLWLLAIENRGVRPVRLARTPHALSFQVKPPETKKEEDAEPVEPATCGEPQKSLEENEMVILPSGMMLTYAFNPRSYCKNDDVLVEGATIVPRYGWPIATRKIWRRGQLVEEEIEQEAPFVSQEIPNENASPEPAQATEDQTDSSENPTPPPPRKTRLKNLLAPEFELGETYPLDEVFALLPEKSPQAEEDSSREDMALAPKRRLSLSVYDMGSTHHPDLKTIAVTVRNVSNQSLRIFFRREHLTFQVNGPHGIVTCRLPPSDRAPAKQAFSYLPSGTSYTLRTRLPEICPQGTFDAPGTYMISARLDAESRGSEYGYDAFVGTLMTSTPARLVVLGENDQERPTMHLRPRHVQ